MDFIGSEKKQSSGKRGLCRFSIDRFDVPGPCVACGDSGAICGKPVDVKKA
jgi:hypothetical protein